VPPPAINYTSGEVSTPRCDGAAGWPGSQPARQRQGRRRRAVPTDDTELAKLVGGELGHHLALEHGDDVDGGLLGQSLGGSSSMNGLRDFGLPHLLLDVLPVLLPLLGQDPLGSPLLRFRRRGLRHHFLLAGRWVRWPWIGRRPRRPDLWSSMRGRWGRWLQQRRRRRPSPWLGFGREGASTEREGASAEREGKNEAICLCRLDPGRTRGTRGRTRAVWADAFLIQI
jgi:hypothetical protein